mmetsp:Transcript_30287/g.87301  ORF Transcript_30287/g.87301 Transcript_30287/m.87301 type:complete len:839 (-) Transcript_30287:307-2823(-)
MAGGVGNADRLQRLGEEHADETAVGIAEVWQAPPRRQGGASDAAPSECSTMPARTTSDSGTAATPQSWAQPLPSSTDSMANCCMADMQAVPTRASMESFASGSEKMCSSDIAAAAGQAARQAVALAFRDLAPTLVTGITADVVRELSGQLRQLERLFNRHQSFEALFPQLQDAVREVVATTLLQADFALRKDCQSPSALSQESAELQPQTSTNRSLPDVKSVKSHKSQSALSNPSEASSAHAGKVQTKGSLPAFKTPTVQSLELSVVDSVLEQSGYSLGRAARKPSREGRSTGSPSPTDTRRSPNLFEAAKVWNDHRQVSGSGSSASAPGQLSPDSGIGASVLGAGSHGSASSPTALSRHGVGDTSAGSPASGSVAEADIERQMPHKPQSLKLPVVRSHNSASRKASFDVIVPSCEADINADEEPYPQGLSPLSVQSGTRPRTTSQILEVRVQELTSEVVMPEASGSRSPSEGGDAVATRTSMCACPKEPLALRICGVLPWDELRRPHLTRAIQWLARLVMALAFAMVMFDTLTARDNFWSANKSCGRKYIAACWQHRGVLSQLPVAAGAVVGVLLFGTSHRGRSLAQTFRLSAMMVRGKGFNDRQQRQLGREKLLFLLAWVCNVTIFMVSTFYDVGLSTPSLGSAIHCLCLSMQSAVILCLTFSIGYVCRTLTLVVDLFCCDVLDTFRLPEVPHAWNVTQAVLRKASSSIELCLVTLCVTLAFAIPLLLVDVQAFGGKMRTMLILLPGFIITCGVFYVLLLAALVSEKCARVPALINALSFGPGTDRTRQHTVDYIVSSAAGFYVFGMRLTTAMVLKFMYTWSIIAIGLVTRLLSLH